MNYLILSASLIVSYLIGGISFARIIGKKVIPDEDLENLSIDIEEKESAFNFQSVSATVIRQKAGTKYGCLTSILDMLKAFVPVLVLRLLFPGQPYFIYAAASSVVGHNFPVYYRFRGGRGMSPIYGGLFVIDWLTIPVTTAIGSIIGGVVFRFILMSYFGVTLLIIPWLMLRFPEPPYLIYAVVVNICFWVASIPELKEYRSHAKRGDFSHSHYFIHPGAEYTGKLLKKLKDRRDEKRRERGTLPPV